MADKKINVILASRATGDGYTKSEQGLNRVDRAAARANKGTAEFSHGYQQSMAKAAAASGKHWADIKAAWDMALGAIRKIGGFIRDAIKKAFDAEYALANFSTLLGSIDKAKEHIAELKQFAASTPLTFGDLSKASKTLLAFGADVKTVMPSLRMLGDISLGNAEKMQSLSLAFGKIQSEGKLTGVTLKQMVIAGFNPLVEVSQKTGASMDELKDMMEKGSISFDLVAAAIRSATSEGGRFHKAMETASKTGSGMMSTLSDNWTAALVTFGQAFSDAAKDGIGEMNDRLKELNEDGTIELWANKTVKALNDVVEASRAVGNALKWVWEKSGASDIYHMGKGFIGGTAYAVTRTVSGMSNGESFDQAFRAARQEGSEVFGRESLRGHWMNKAGRAGYLGRGGLVGTAMNDEEDARERWEDEQLQQSRRARRKAREDEAAAKKQEVKNELTVEQAFAAEKQKLEADAAKKTAEERQKAEIAAAQAAAKERERLDREAHQKRMADLRAEIDVQNKAKSAQSAIAAAAQSEFERAFAMYRDPERAAQEIGEEKARSADLDRLHKDARRYGGQWRIDELSALMSAGDTQGVQSRLQEWRKNGRFDASTEALVRASAAEKTRTTAEDELRKISANTADLAAKLEELLAMKE